MYSEKNSDLFWSVRNVLEFPSRYTRTLSAVGERRLAADNAGCTVSAKAASVGTRVADTSCSTLRCGVEYEARRFEPSSCGPHWRCFFYFAKLEILHQVST